LLKTELLSDVGEQQLGREMGQHGADGGEKRESIAQKESPLQIADLDDAWALRCD